MEFQAFQRDPSGALALLLLDLLLTALFYGAGPVLFVVIRKSPVTLRFFRNVCVLYTIFVYLLFSALYLLSGTDGVPNMAAAFIWGVLFYRVCRKKLRQKAPERADDAAAKEPERADDAAAKEPEQPALEAPGEPAGAAVEAPRQIAEDDRSRFRMPGRQLEDGKPGRRAKAGIALLAAALVCSLCINGYQAASMQKQNSALEQLESDISVYQGKISQLEASYQDAKERADAAQEEGFFLCSRIGMIVEGSPYYHSYLCEVFQNADEFWAHNVEYCRALGYSECPECGWILD